MTRSEWIQRAVASGKWRILEAVEVADKLEQSEAAPWDDDLEGGPELDELLEAVDEVLEFGGLNADERVVLERLRKAREAFVVEEDDETP